MYSWDLGEHAYVSEAWSFVYSHYGERHGLIIGDSVAQSGQYTEHILPISVDRYFVFCSWQSIPVREIEKLPMTRSFSFVPEPVVPRHRCASCVLRRTKRPLRRAAAAGWSWSTAGTPSTSRAPAGGAVRVWEYWKVGLYWKGFCNPLTRSV